MHVIGSREEGGAERLYVRLTAALAERGEDVLCVLRPSSVLTDRLDARLPRKLVRMRSVFDPFARARLGIVARGFGAQVVQTYMGRATRIARFDVRNKAGVVHVARVGSYGDVKTVRHATGWLASTEGIRQHLLAADLPEQRVFHVPHMVEPAPTPLEPHLRDERRVGMGLEPDCILLLCLGRLHRDRGIDLMLDAMARLPLSISGRPLRLLVVGDGPQREPLLAQATTLKLDERVRWVHGEATPDPYMGLADMFVYPSREATVGTGILEAWSHGLAVVASRTAAGRELLEPLDPDGLVPVDDAVGLADAIMSALQAPTVQRQALIERAREVVHTRYSASAVVSRCLEAYARLTTERA